MDQSKKRQNDLTEHPPPAKKQCSPEASAPPVFILDGGNGHLLRRMGVKIEGPIGSIKRFLGVGLANVEDPSMVRAAHETYLKAGASVVTTNTYACIPAVVGREKTLETLQAGGLLAREAADKFPGARVAGCLPPLHESYRPDKVAPQEELIRDYKLIAEGISKHSDLLLCETMSAGREAAAAVAAAKATGKPIWVSLCLAEEASGKLHSGETIEEVVEMLGLTEGGSVQAVMFNCSQPEAISAALPRLRDVLPAGVSFGAYANGFATVKSPGASDGSEYRDDSPEAYAALCEQWVNMGATVVGGCCGIFPEHISAVSAALAGRKSVNMSATVVD